MKQPNFQKFCPVPFTSLVFNPNGKVGCCREKGTEHFIGDITKESVLEIWNNPKIQEWRKEFLTGNIKTCAQEMQHNSCHLEKYNQALLPFVEFQLHQTQGPKRISPDFNGECNLRCPMCHVWTMTKNPYKQSKSFQKEACTHIFPEVVQVDCLGGEPFIQEDFFFFMKKMSQIAPLARWKITTNGHWHFTKTIKEHLELINLECLSFSLDSLNPETYKKIRTGDLTLTLNNIQKVITYFQGKITFLFNFTIQKSNWQEIKEMIQFTQKNKAIPYIQYLYTPEKYSLSNYPLDRRLKILQTLFNELNDDEIGFSHRVLRALIDSLPQKYQMKWKRWLKAITQNKGPDLIETENTF